VTSGPIRVDPVDAHLACLNGIEKGPALFATTDSRVRPRLTDDEQYPARDSAEYPIDASRSSGLA